MQLWRKEWSTKENKVSTGSIILFIYYDTSIEAATVGKKALNNEEIRPVMLAISCPVSQSVENSVK